ncbi:hypothetical protein GU926_08450 [Nibribacter ruber]|uniref:Uncharacterized protein n=1 Tax=Nibribacter ruber TaxID=2698458 RepID=A0A6P1NZA5_9BACT|nr:hypothetical protein [Nibribacter ruber]QHL87465.1 hypothetical protein GU926_08450 [Nibribacter ruber]
MKRLLFFLLVISWGCKDDAPVVPKNPITLEIKALEWTTSSMDAVISLYDSEQNWEARTGAIKSQTTTSNGKAIFTNLAPRQYWWRVEKGCLLNDYSDFSTRRALKEEEYYSAKTYLVGSFTLELVNTSALAFEVTLNYGTAPVTVNGNSTLTIKRLKAEYDYITDESTTYQISARVKTNDASKPYEQIGFLTPYCGKIEKVVLPK